MHFTRKIYNLQDLKNTLHNNSSNTIKNIGLLGGSFNPAHIGHLKISQYALSELGMDYIIWLIAEQNPLKPPYKWTLQERAEFANHAANHPQILVSTAEIDIGSKCTYDTLLFLVHSFPNINFVWLMGVDCIAQFHLWENFDKFTEIVEIAIFDRTCDVDVKNSIAGKELLKKRKHRVVFCTNKKINISSTAIRTAKHDA